MEKVEENKEEIKKQIEKTEKDIQELAETQPVLANQLMNDLELFKILTGENKD
jgi:prefoldin subunit 5